MALTDSLYDLAEPTLSPGDVTTAVPSGQRRALLDPGFNLTLRPMRYPVFYEMYRNAIKNTWTVEEVDFSRDTDDLDNKLLPGMATLANDAVGNPSVPQATKDLILNLLDTDNDGTITSTEIKNNALIGAVLAPDVDTDNDGTADALSVGIGFTAVTCTINKGP